MALLDFDGDVIDLSPPPVNPKPTARPSVGNARLHDLVLTEDRTAHSWREFGEFAHHCTCGDPEAHHNRLVALSKGKT